MSLVTRALTTPRRAAVAAVAAWLCAGPAFAQRPADSQKAPAGPGQVGQSQSQSQVKLQPHRAVYDFTLGSVRSEKSITGVSGRLVYEFTGSVCEGWTQTMRFVTRTTTSSGSATVTDQRSTSWEDDGATQLRFASSQYRDQKLVEQTGGTATRSPEEGDMRVDLSRPDKKRSAVTGTAMFPIQHSIKLIEAARRGRPSLTADFYDGGDGGEKIYSVSAQIGKPVPAGFNKLLPRAGEASKLDNVPAWPIQLSYYEPGNEGKDAIPAYEMGFVFYANGVSRRLTIDNGDYVMKGELSELAYIEPLPCRK